jgi:LPS sulfotransferase NodH
VVGHSNFVPFIVLTRSRSGSNLLLSFLNSHPNIHAEPEIFGRTRGRDPLRRLRIALGKQPRRIKAKGFKIFYYHPLDNPSEKLWKTLEAMELLRVIHLRRENVLRTLISRKVAEGDKVWMVTDRDATPAAPRPKLSFTVSELESGFVQTREWEIAGAHRFRSHPLLAVTYESLVSQPDATFARILEFLDLDFHAPQTGLQKQNPGRLCDLMENYEELRDAFAGTPWREYFKD